MKILALSGVPGAGKDTVAEYLIKTHKAVHVKFAHPLQDMAAIMLDLYRKDLKHRLSFVESFKDNTRHVISSAELKEEYIPRLTAYICTNTAYPNYCELNLPGLNYIDYQIEHVTDLLSEHLPKYIHPYTSYTPRDLLKILGTEIGRNVLYRNIWVDTLVKEVKKLNTKELVVISDMRRLNEHTAIRCQFLGKTCHIYNTKASILARHKGLLSHESEAGGEYSYAVINNTNIKITEPEYLELYADYHLTNNSDKSDLYIQIDDLIKDYLH